VEWRLHLQKKTTQKQTKDWGGRLKKEKLRRSSRISQQVLSKIAKTKK
jgi:hypothetical protein